MTSPVLEASELYRFYRAGEQETLALRGVSLQVSAGETVAVVGPSGSGKSTLLSILAGLDEPAGGTVRVCGERVSHRPEPERTQLRAGRIGVLMQSGNLLSHLTVVDNVRLAQSATRKKGQRPLADILADVGLQSHAKALPRQLSGGQLARAGLAVALANDPDVLLADEPTGELDGATEDRVVDLIARYAGDGMAILIATHSSKIRMSADRTIQLRDGKVD